MGVMETVSITSRDYSSPSGKLVTRQYEVMNITEDVRVDPKDMPEECRSVDSLKKYVEDPNAYKRPYMMLQCVDNAEIRGMNQEVNSEGKAVIKDFFDGKISAEELKENFKSLAYRSFQCLWENNYPNFLACNDVRSQKAMIESFYSEFRREVLAGAVDKNNAVGRQYCSDASAPSWAWKYYNSDYYFKSEEALKAITDGVMEIAHARGYDDFEIPDYGAKGLNLYNNFNTAWCNNFDMSQQYILDPNQAPPKDFEWFFEQGYGDKNVYGGVAIPEEEYLLNKLKGPVYDPTDKSTGTTWAAYRDANGVRHRISADMLFESHATDLYNVTALIQFTEGDSALDAAMNRFLANLQVYPRAHQFGSPGTFNIRA